MKFGVVGPLPPLRGGISHYNESLIQSLHNADHKIIPLSYTKLYPSFLFPGSTQYNDTESFDLPKTRYWLTPWLPQTWVKAIYIIKNSHLDRLIVHHWHPFFVPCLAFILKNLSGIKTIIIAHNVLPHEHQAAGKILNKILFNVADVVFVGNSQEQAVLQRLAGKVQSVISPHPIYDRFSRQFKEITREQAKQRLGYSGETFLFLHLGLVRQYKGVDVLLQAFSEMRAACARLEIAGEFYDDVEKYRNLVRNLDLENRVRLIDQYQTDADISLRLRAADAVVLPYRQATQSGIAMAALACGIPVIATRVGALVDIIESGKMGELVPPEDAISLADAMNKFMQIPISQRQEMERYIFRIAQEKYSWENLVHQLESV